MSQPVALKYATAQSFSPGGGISVSSTYIRVKVQNIAFSKDVKAIYKTSTGWDAKPLNWQGGYDNYDIFGTDPSFPYTEEFAVSYSVNGITYWDNNNGRNYVLSNSKNTVGSNNIILNKATSKIGSQSGGGFVFKTSWFEGEIYINNLSFQKKVGVRFSTDGGITWEDRDANYAGLILESTYSSTLGAELWKFKTPEYNFNNASSVFIFVVYYKNQDTGEWFWDNNFLQNYNLNKETNPISIE
jgi:hypothetical protein